MPSILAASTFTSFDDANFALEVADDRLGQLVLELLDLLFERLLVGERLLDLLDQLGLGDAHSLHQAMQSAAGLLVIADGGLRR